MVKIHKLPKITHKKKKRIGLGYGSGRGKTAGRGTKGQKARGKAPAMQIALLKHLPLYSGKYRNKPVRKKPIVVNVKFLNLLPADSVVDVDLLVAKRIVDASLAENLGVKILGDGELSVPLIVKLPCSAGAAKKIVSAGGKVEYQAKINPARAGQKPKTKSKKQKIKNKKS